MVAVQSARTMQLQTATALGALASSSSAARAVQCRMRQERPPSCLVWQLAFFGLAWVLEVLGALGANPASRDPNLLQQLLLLMQQLLLLLQKQHQRTAAELLGEVLLQGAGQGRGVRLEPPGAGAAPAASAPPAASKRIVACRCSSLNAELETRA